MNTAPHAAPVPETPATEGPRLHVRSPEFDFGDEIPRFWLSENTFATHVFNGLNLVFPDGERFFIQAVRDCAARAELPASLKAEIRAFNGQEGRHAFEHERYFEILESQGYEISGFLKRFRMFMGWSNRFMPAPLRLAITAGAEHYTAIFGSFALENPLLDGAHPTMRKLILWHAAEEIEHKHVAFDVLKATHPNVWLRRLGFLMATLDLFGFSIAATRMLLKQDREAGRTTPERARRDKDGLKAVHDRFAGPMRERIRAYWRRDFHPSETDERPRAYERLAEVGVAVS